MTFKKGHPNYKKKSKGRAKTPAPTPVHNEVKQEAPVPDKTAINQDLKATLKDAIRETLLEATQETIDEIAESIADNRPGTIHRGIKRPWTLADIENVSPKVVTFIAEANTSVTVNGVTYWLYSGKECTVPELVYGIYQGSRAQTRDAYVIPDPSVQSLLGAGGLPAEPVAV